MLVGDREVEGLIGELTSFKLDIYRKGHNFTQYLFEMMYVFLQRIVSTMPTRLNTQRFAAHRSRVSLRRAP